jgi:hypothetical protein
MAFSDDRGVNFGAPIGIALGAPFGGVDVVQLSDGSALVSWVERTAAGEAVLVCRATPIDGCGTPVALTVVRSGRTIGFPRMTFSGLQKHRRVASATTTATATPITIITSTTCHKRATFEMEHLVSGVKHVNLDTKPVVFNKKHAIFDTSCATFDTDNAIFI